MKRKSLLICVTLFCLSKLQAQKGSIEIVVDYTWSYTCNLSKQTYTTHYFRGIEDTTVHFSLSEAEKEKILNAYSLLDIKLLPTMPASDESCIMMFPRFVTVLRATSNKSVQRIALYSCHTYSPKYELEVRQLRSFFELFRKLILNKPEIQQAPKSQMMYL